MSYSRPIFLLLIVLNSFFASSQTEGISLGGGGLEVEYTATAPVCFGQNSGSIYIEVTGGTPPYNFDWEDMFDADNPQNRISILSGTYFLIVSDASGDTVSIAITVPAAPEITFDVDIIHESVVGLNDGQINLEISNAQWPWVVEWDTNPISNSQNISNLAPGTYCVTVTGANGCVKEECFIVVDPNTIPLIVSSTIVNPRCESQDRGKITLDVELGAAPLTFDWADLPGIDNEQNRDSLDDGIYEVIITDAFGIQITQIFEIINLIDFDFILNVNDATTTLSGDGSIYFEYVNGNYPLTLDWFDLQDENFQVIRGYLFPGFYCAELTEAQGCKRVKCVTVGVDEISISDEINKGNSELNFSINLFPGGVRIDADQKIKQLNIYNQLGQLVFETENPKAEFMGPTGIYIIQGISDNKAVSKKLYIH